MNALDGMLTGNEPMVQAIASEEGIAAARLFVKNVNNACMQIAGFEDDLVGLMSGFLAPIVSLSHHVH